MSEDTKVPAKVVRVLSPARHQLTEHANADHTVTVEEGTTPDDVVDPAFWAHLASRFSPYDEIRIRTDDGLWYARALVVVCGRNWARVKVLELTQLTTSDIDQSQTDEYEGYEVRFRGPLHKFAVIRKSDSAVLKEGFMKAEAYAWLADYLKVTA